MALLNHFEILAGELSLLGVLLVSGSACGLAGFEEVSLEEGTFGVGSLAF